MTKAATDRPADRFLAAATALPERTALLVVMPEKTAERFRRLELMVRGIIDLLFENVPKQDHLFRKYIGQTSGVQPASVLWNTSFVVDYCFRSSLLANTFATELAAIRDALFQYDFEPVRAFVTELRLEPLFKTPRSLPHVVSLKLSMSNRAEEQPLLERVARFYSPRSVGFHEAEYVTLQLLSVLIHHLGRIGDEARGVAARYLSDCLAAIEEVLGQNDNVFCNEQFNDKYNVLLLQNVINLIERLEDPAARSALHDHGINRPKLLGFVDRLLPKIFTRAALRSVTDETEYLLYLIDYVALRARATDIDVVWRMLENLLDELLERYRDGRGVTASRALQKTFNFHVPLTVAVYERLLGVERP